MISDLSDLENLIKLESDSKTKQLHLISDVRVKAKKLLDVNEGLEKRVLHLKSVVEKYGLENEQLRRLV